MKFAHLSDLHLGSFREKFLRDLNFDAFDKCIDNLIFEKVDFCIICGDIFDTPNPDFLIIDKFVDKILKLKKNEIEVYIILGSHDIFNFQKSFLDILEKTNLFKIVSNYKLNDDKLELLKTTDKKTKANIYGFSAKKKELDKKLYSKIFLKDFEDKSFNIFMFHTSITNFELENETLLPKNCDYYAGGHIHNFLKTKYDKGILSYPGPMFPNNFDEMKNINPAYNMCHFENNNLTILNKQIKNFEKEIISFDCNNLTPLEIKKNFDEVLEKTNAHNKVVLFEIFGEIDGKIIDIELNKLVDEIYNKGANFVLKNSYKLRSKVFDKNIIKDFEDKNLAEEKIIESFLENENDKKVAKKILNEDFEKFEEERIFDYEKRVLEKIKNILS